MFFCWSCWWTAKPCQSSFARYWLGHLVQQMSPHHVRSEASIPMAASHTAMLLQVGVCPWCPRPHGFPQRDSWFQHASWWYSGFLNVSYEIVGSKQAQTHLSLWNETLRCSRGAEWCRRIGAVPSEVIHLNHPKSMILQFYEILHD